MMFDPRTAAGRLAGLVKDRERAGLWLLPAFIAACMLVVEAFGLQQSFLGYHGSFEVLRDLPDRQIEFLSHLNYSLFCVVFFVALPLLFHLVFPIEDPNPFGLSLRGVAGHWPVYLSLTLLMLPVLWVMAGRSGFMNFYPLFDPPTLRYWLAYEAVYLFQFVAVEFFFRGFALFRLERAVGRYAIMIMVLPYALLHVHKPLAEALASIIAGIVLGYLALRWRSIFPGIFIHVSVAFLMDLFALLRSGRFGVL